jgi:hypothetical protein
MFALECVLIVWSESILRMWDRREGGRGPYLNIGIANDHLIPALALVKLAVTSIHVPRLPRREKRARSSSVLPAAFT